MTSENMQAMCKSCDLQKFLGVSVNSLQLRLNYLLVLFAACSTDEQCECRLWGQRHCEWNWELTVCWETDGLLHWNKDSSGKSTVCHLHAFLSPSQYHIFNANEILYWFYCATHYLRSSL